MECRRLGNLPVILGTADDLRNSLQILSCIETDTPLLKVSGRQSEVVPKNVFYD